MTETKEQRMDVLVPCTKMMGNRLVVYGFETKHIIILPFPSSPSAFSPLGSIFKRFNERWTLIGNNPARFLSCLPFRSVADKWGIETRVDKSMECAAWYDDPKWTPVLSSPTIGLRYTGAGLWLHELCHAADDRLGNLPEVDPKETLLPCSGQGGYSTSISYLDGRSSTVTSYWDAECVAEFSATMLLCLLGKTDDYYMQDRYEVIGEFLQKCNAPTQDVHKAISRTLIRSQKVIQLILDTAAELGDMKIAA